MKKLSLLLCLAVFAFILAGCTAPAKPDGKMVLYFKTDCSHCQNVEKFIQDNKVNEKITFAKKSVDTDQNNIAELIQKAKICGMAQDSIGVPFFWDGSKCITGDTEIIKYFQEKI